MTFLQTAVNKPRAAFQENYWAFLLYCTKAWKWWNLESSAETELMSQELARQFKAENCVNKLTVNKS